MALKLRVWAAGRFLLLAFALLLTYLLFAAAAARVALRALEVRVPDLRGLSPSDATVRLSDLGLRLRVDEARRPDPKVPRGHIALQQPEAAATARRGRNVRVWISDGAQLGRVPQLVGETDRTARSNTEPGGVTVTSAEIRSSAYPAGMVIAQDPAPRTDGNSVSILVNRGERGATYVMPDLIGVNGARAAAVLRARGFRVALVGEEPYPGIPPGIVLRQSPEAGFQIAPGQPISIEVSR